MKVSTLFLAALPAVIAAPNFIPDQCKGIDWLIAANHASSNAAYFCTKYLSITTETVTKSATTTVTGPQITLTSTATAKTAATITSSTTITSTATTSTTSYAISTCTPATPYTPPAATATAGVVEARSDKFPSQWCWSWPWPYPTPKYIPAQISAACSCIATTPTVTATKTATVTKPGATQTRTTTTTLTTSTSTIYKSTTVTTTTTNTIASTQLRPFAPTGTYVSPNGATFEDYNGIDFLRGDLDGGVFCSCDNQGDPNLSDCVVRGTNYGKCTGFNSCQDICAGINNQTQALTCVAVTYNGPDASGACYFKQSLEGCGIINDGRRSGLIELNGYKFASTK